MKEKKGCGNGGGEKGKLKSLRRKGVYKLLCCNFVLNCNLFTHGALKSSEELVEKCPCDPDRIGIWKGWVFFFLRKGENRGTRRKTSRRKEENQQQTQPTYGIDTGIRNQATLVKGECSHHCVTLASHPCF